MKEVSVRLVTRSSELPQLACRSFFHSTELFRMAEETPGYEPCMAVAEYADGHHAAHLLALVWHHRTLLPPWRYSHGRVYGEGEYAPEADKESVFGQMLAAATAYFKRKRCTYIEFSHIGNKMFGYKLFRDNGYFPVTWQEIHNSLHSLAPEERISKKLKNKIAAATRHGATTKIMESKQEFDAFYKIMLNYFRLKSRRDVPHKTMFRMLLESGRSKTFLTTYKDKLVGGCVCLMSDNNAYLWYLASKRKTYHNLWPNAMSVWAAIKHAHSQGLDHMYFLDVGLPFKNNPLREFIMEFGGKPVSKYRWFRLPWPPLNKAMFWLYNDK